MSNHAWGGGLARPEDVNYAEHNRVGDVSTGRAFKAVQEVPQKVLVDEVSSTVTYVGFAGMGTATSSSLWRIMRVSVSGTVTSIEFADSNDLYDNKWDDRLTLTYG